MNKNTEGDFTFQVDGWIKSFKKDLEIFSSEMDDYNDEVNNHREELQFNFENLCRLENRIDRIEIMLEKVLGNMNTDASTTKVSNLQQLKDKTF